MRGKSALYTFVMEFLGGTYVHQGVGESPELALRAWLHIACEEEFEWGIHRLELLKQLADEAAVPIEGLRNVWCLSGMASDHLFLIHIIATESGSAAATSLAEAELEEIGTDPKLWGWGDRW